MDKENTSGVLRTKVIISPRENPRDWVRSTANEFPLGDDSSKDKMHDRDKFGDKPKFEPEETRHDYCGDDKDVDGIMLKLQRVDYYTEELLSKEKEEAVFLLQLEGLSSRETWVWKHLVLGRNRCPES